MKRNLLTVLIMLFVSAFAFSSTKAMKYNVIENVIEIENFSTNGKPIWKNKGIQILNDTSVRPLRFEVWRKIDENSEMEFLASMNIERMNNLSNSSVFNYSTLSKNSKYVYIICKNANITCKEVSFKKDAFEEREYLYISIDSASEIQSNFDIQIEYETENPMLTLEVQPTWDGIASVCSSKQGFCGFHCTFTNNMGKPVRIVWEGSSMYYNDETYDLFVTEDAKQAIRGNMTDITVLPKGGLVSRDIYSDKQSKIDYNLWGIEQLKMTSIDVEEVQILFLIVSSGSEEYVTVTIKAID